VLSKFDASGATSLNLEVGSKNITLKKQPEPMIYSTPVYNETENTAQEEEKSNLYIEADRVGKYFSIHPPDSPDRLKVGDTIAEGERMGHVVSMEVVYDVFAPFDLVVRGILINDNDPVEYGQALYEVEAI